MNQVTPTADIARRIVEILEEHKGEDILFLDVSDQVDFTDYFIIVSATSDRNYEIGRASCRERV